MRVFGYIRVSSSGQARDGYSLASQRKSVHDFSRSKGLELLRVFTDEGISGVESKISERKALLAMLAELGSVDAILVVHTSRLWRDDIAKALIKRELLSHGVEIISIEQAQYRISTKDPSEFLVNGMMELLDQFVKMQLVMNMEKGRLEKLANGGFPGGGVPLGYSTSSGELVISDIERQLVDIIIKLRKKGYGFNRIAKIMNERGIKGKRGGSFHHSTIRKIISNAIYIGEMTYGKHKVKGKHEPILSKVSFSRANGVSSGYPPVGG